MNFLLTLLLIFTIPIKSFAYPACTVCTIAIGATLSIARKLGVSDSIVGLWSGAMLALIGYWTILFFEKKKWNFKGRDPLLMISSIGMIGFIYIKETTYNPKVILNILYLDVILFSTIVGALTFIYSNKLYQYMKKQNGGHAHFPFEKVVLPIAVLGLLSWYFSFIKF